ncbi:hypothetical protein R1flu_018392 [Riccia fluitans]|uniref:Uncharacterized protein n=1 Tax=Riccia fluitans TaxID=41844 RepID=A0ABD1ZFQ3_9MARC
MENFPAVAESCRIKALESEVKGTTPCKIGAVSKDTLCLTPMTQVLTASPGIAGEMGESVHLSGKAETVAKPPLVPVRVLDIEHSEAENENSQEMSTKIELPLKSAALLKEMPFKERNREEVRRMIPPHIKVPPKKLFGYPEKYKSPTDAMVSPISKGLLARNRRPARTLAPVVPPKALENTFQDVVVNREAGDLK